MGAARQARKQLNAAGTPLSRTVLMGFSQGGAMAQGCGIEIAFGWVGVSEWLLALDRQNSPQAKLFHLFCSRTGIRDTVPLAPLTRRGTV
ncbi:MAG: hypothetical protein KME26_29255 [Oscillatoria princeps RMCB-10]|nr:hypothetical protein [Oscillatoria princeps RMCB-10]